MAVDTTQLTLLADGRRYDLAVPPGTKVREVLATLGIASSAQQNAVATASGTVLGPHDALGEDLPPGSVLTVVRMTTHAVHRDVLNLDRSTAGVGGRLRQRRAIGSGARARLSPTAPPEPDADESTRRRNEVEAATIVRAQLRRAFPATVSARRARGHATPPVSAVGLLVALAAALGIVSLVTAVLALLEPGGGAGTGGLEVSTLRWAAAGLLAVGAAALALVPARDGPDIGLAVAPALALAAGVTAPLSDGPGRVLVAVLLGCVVVVTLVTAVLLREHRPAGARSVLACFAVLGLIALAALLRGWPTELAAALVTGLAPLVVRLLPSTSLQVEPTQLVDHDRLSTTVWSVRGSRPAGGHRVRRSTVRDVVAEARSVVALGTAYVSVLAAVGGWCVVLSGVRPSWTPWAPTALVLAASLAFGYQARAVRDRLARYSMLAAAGTLVLAGTYAVVRTGSGAAVALLVVTLVVLAAVAVIAGVALADGFRSVRFSRLADLLEGSAVGLCLPLAVLAADGIEMIRRFASG